MQTCKLMRHTHEPFLITFFVLITLSLAGCGGGSSESEPQQTQAPEQTQASDDTSSTNSDTDSDTTSVDYAPDDMKLEQAASKSEELYVEPEFQFDTFKSVTLDVLLTNNDGQPMVNTLIFVSAIDQNITELDDPELANKSLITVLKTDESGAVYRQLEMSQSVTKVLFEINAIGTNNEYIQDIGDVSEVHVQL